LLEVFDHRPGWLNALGCARQERRGFNLQAPAVTDIALNAGTFPIRAKALATRLGLNLRLSAGSQH
jgi:hypothetical protein